jgi:outer membrane biogenesis lipoprotein LolB
MKTGNALIAVTAVLMLAACSQSGESPAAQANGEAVILAVKGMNCAA